MFVKRRRDAAERKLNMNQHHTIRLSSWARIVLLSLLLGVGVLASFGLSGRTAHAQPATTITAPPTPVLNWHPCVNPLVAGFECATAKVPLDYTDVHGAMINLAVIKHTATNPAHRIGSLFFNPGGPGGAGTEDLPAFYQFFPTELQQDFDLLSWDPRGIGQSTAVQCFPTAEDEGNFFANLPAGFPVGRAEQNTWISLYARFSMICNQGNPALLSHVSTAESARDMDLLRQAVGDSQLNYLGVSYGTYLGATYANLFPGKVRAMVLDGNINPVAWTTLQQVGRVQLSTGIRLESDLGAAATLKQFLNLCGEASTKGCAFSAGSARATEEKYANLLQHLRTHPVTVSIPAFGDIPQSAPHRFTYATVISATVGFLTTTEEVGPQSFHGWSYGAFVLQTLWTASGSGSPTHTDSSSASQQASWSVTAARSSPVDSESYAGPEQASAIECADSPNPRNPADYRALAAFAYARSGDVGPNTSWADEACATWQATDADGYFGPWNRRTANPVLVVGNTYDPSTPYQDSVKMANELARARLLTVDGYGHTDLLNPSHCVNGYESSYFVHGVLPSTGTMCHQDRRPFSTDPQS
jgi:pimeloyl-ACP methyl ester carboxylesterase